ncbi:MAG: DNA polymerase III subunit epsilon [Alphaproteobacteria bacterium]|nr:DNA polymerase III subunit epsilon [Alphaproteobacteria bacterium]
MREIVFDTETTGLDPNSGHRIVEIGCVELVNHLPTGNHFHRYLNPERDVPDEVVRVHGLTRDFLANHPTFAEVVADFLDFMGQDAIVAHNAGFDMGFLNHELGRLGFPPLPMSRVTDTVQLARRKFPGASASLDALCRRFDIDLTVRDKHGALVDAELLAEVYLELIGGRQPGLELMGQKSPGNGMGCEQGGTLAVQVRPPRAHAPSPTELEAHNAAIAKIKNALWLAGQESS